MAHRQAQLRRNYMVLRAQLRVLESHTGSMMPNGAGQEILRVVTLAREAFPELVQAFDGAKERADGMYRVTPFRLYLAGVVAMFEAELATDDSPAVESKVFPAVVDAGLRAIVERDYREVQRAFIAQCWKSTIILSGGAIEAILTDLLMANATAALAASAAPKKPDIAKWDLANLIDVAVELKLVSAGVAKLSHPLREYRNLVHPGNEMRSGLVFGQEEARIALEVLKILHRDLHP